MLRLCLCVLCVCLCLYQRIWLIVWFRTNSSQRWRAEEVEEIEGAEDEEDEIEGAEEKEDETEGSEDEGEDE